MLLPLTIWTRLQKYKDGSYHYGFWLGYVIIQLVGNSSFIHIL